MMWGDREKEKERRGGRRIKVGIVSERGQAATCNLNMVKSPKSIARVGKKEEATRLQPSNFHLPPSTGLSPRVVLSQDTIVRSQVNYAKDSSRTVR